MATSQRDLFVRGSLFGPVLENDDPLEDNDPWEQDDPWEERGCREQLLLTEQ